MTFAAIYAVTLAIAAIYWMATLEWETINLPAGVAFPICILGWLPLAIAWPITIPAYYWLRARALR
jgi:hypothetical protein